MKKLFLGIFIGVFLSLGASVYADDIQSLVGQTVAGTFPIQVNGSSLPTDAIVVNNISYLPVRIVGELLNLDISFIDNQVIIKAKDGLVNMEKLQQQKLDADTKQAKWEKDRQDRLKQIDITNKQTEDFTKKAEDAAKQSKDEIDAEIARKKKAADDEKKFQDSLRQSPSPTPTLIVTPSPTPTPTSTIIQTPSPTPNVQ